RGAKGRRWYAWSRVALATVGAPEGWQRWLLVRRSLHTGELAYYVCAGPASLPLIALVRGAGGRGGGGARGARDGARRVAGGWRRRSRPARGCAAWTSTRSAAGAPGTAG